MIIIKHAFNNVLSFNFPKYQLEAYILFKSQKLVKKGHEIEKFFRPVFKIIIFHEFLRKISARSPLF